MPGAMRGCLYRIFGLSRTPPPALQTIGGPAIMKMNLTRDAVTCKLTFNATAYKPGERLQARAELPSSAHYPRHVSRAGHPARVLKKISCLPAQKHCRGSRAAASLTVLSRPPTMRLDLSDRSL